MEFRCHGYLSGVAANNPPAKPPEDGQFLERRFEVMAEPALDEAIRPASIPAFLVPGGTSIRHAIRVGPSTGSKRPLRPNSVGFPLVPFATRSAPI